MASRFTSLSRARDVSWCAALPKAGRIESRACSYSGRRTAHRRGEEKNRLPARSQVGPRGVRVEEAQSGEPKSANTADKSNALGEPGAGIVLHFPCATRIAPFFAL